jgi:hypothetical protein
MLHLKLNPKGKKWIKQKNYYVTEKISYKVFIDVISTLCQKMKNIFMLLEIKCECNSLRKTLNTEY